jgi:hypothetical protein
LRQIYAIAKDILLSIHYLHAKAIYHLGLNPLSLQVLPQLDKFLNEETGEDEETKKQEAESYLPSFKSDEVEDMGSKQERSERKLIRIHGFCISSGFTKKKYS